MDASEPILFIYNTGGVRAEAPALNVDRQAYTSIGPEQPSAAPLIGAYLGCGEQFAHPEFPTGDYSQQACFVTAGLPDA